MRGPRGCMGPPHDKKKVQKIYCEVVSMLKKKYGLFNFSEMIVPKYRKRPYKLLKDAIDEIVSTQEASDF